MTAISARCFTCGTTFSCGDAATGVEKALACPSCGSTVVRGRTSEWTRVERDTTRCTICGATFHRSESVTDVKGELVCPECGEREGLEQIERR